MFSLVFSTKDGSDITAPLHDGLIVGSGDGSDLLVEHHDISQCHAKIYVNPEDSGWWVRDLESVTGTFINGARVSSGRIHHGDEISFGPVAARLADHEETPHKRAVDK